MAPRNERHEIFRDLFVILSFLSSHVNLRVALVRYQNDLRYKMREATVRFLAQPDLISVFGGTLPFRTFLPPTFQLTKYSAGSQQVLGYRRMADSCLV